MSRWNSALIAASCIVLGFAWGYKLGYDRGASAPSVSDVRFRFDSRYPDCAFETSPLLLDNERLVYLAGVWRAACVAEVERREREAGNG